MHEGWVRKSGNDMQQDVEELVYIERMCSELANMAARSGYEFVSYLLSMAVLAVREERMKAEEDSSGSPCALVSDD